VIVLALAVVAAACSGGGGSSAAPPSSGGDTTVGVGGSTTTGTAPQFGDPVAGEAARKCAGWLGDPISGSAEWDVADQNNQMCAVEGLRIVKSNPAVAAAASANGAAGEGNFGGDPFRAPHRWAGTRGSYEKTTFTDREGNSWPAALFGPLDANGGPHPGVLLVCHACFPLPQTTEDIGVWYWAAEALAEAGYVVLYATVGGNSVPRAADAADYFVATPEAPTSRGESNPWHARLDRSRLAIVGHSGGAGVALALGNTDPRFDAIVAWDPAASATLEGVTPTKPTMIQLADYTLRDGAVPRSEKPTPAPGSKYTYFDMFAGAGVDVMQVSVRASAHMDWSRPVGGIAAPQISNVSLTHSVYGEMVATFYTLAWLDKYLSTPTAGDALRRLKASGTDPFDSSADRYSIGAGFFDAGKAARQNSDEAGNVPITIGGLPVRNLLSFQYKSRYFLDGGASVCDDLRAGCNGGG
jgi:dienelactone hydrolase